MKKVFSNILFFLSYSAYALTPSQIFEKVKDSIVVIYIMDEQMKLKAQGSGVVLPTKKIATNCHVIENSSYIMAERNKKLSIVKYDSGDLSKDICLLETSKSFTAKGVELGKTTNLKVGQYVYAIGAPAGLELSISDGIISQLRGKNPPLIQTTASISPGSSGGGLFDTNGKLIGLTTLQRKNAQNLNFAIPVEYIKNQLEYRQTIRMQDTVLDAIKNNECIIDKKGVCIPFSIRLKDQNDIENANYAGFKIDGNIIYCSSISDCTAQARSLINSGIVNLDLGLYQINYKYYPNSMLQEYFDSNFAREHVNFILSNLVKRYGYSWETLGRYRYSPEQNPYENEIYYKKLYAYIYGNRSKEDNTNVAIEYEEPAKEENVEAVKEDDEPTDKIILDILENLREECKKGNGQSCHKLGIDYYIKNDYIAAFTYNDLACGLNNGAGCEGIAEMYHDGLGVKQKFDQALYFYIKSCDLNFGVGCAGAGSMYYNGEGTAKDLSIASAYYKKSCELDIKDSCKTLKEIQELLEKNKNF